MLTHNISFAIGEIMPKSKQNKYENNQGSKEVSSSDRKSNCKYIIIFLVSYIILATTTQVL